jgi:hypothetical protein
VSSNGSDALASEHPACTEVVDLMVRQLNTVLAMRIREQLSIFYAVKVSE